MILNKQELQCKIDELKLIETAILAYNQRKAHIKDQKDAGNANNGDENKDVHIDSEQIKYFEELKKQTQITMTKISSSNSSLEGVSLKHLFKIYFENFSHFIYLIEITLINTKQS